MYGSSLRPREMQVVALAADGMTDRQIATRLGIAPRTAKDYLGLARVRLGAVNRAQMVHLAHQRGLLSSDGRTGDLVAGAYEAGWRAAVQSVLGMTLAEVVAVDSLDALAEDAGFGKTVGGDRR